MRKEFEDFVTPIYNDFVTEWKETEGGFSCEPITHNFVLGIKARNYRLETAFIKSKYPDDAIGFQKIKTATVANIYFDRDLYLSEKGFDELKPMIFKHTGEIMTTNLLRQIECEFYQFLKCLYASNDLGFTPPVVLACDIQFSFEGVECAKEQLKKIVALPVYKIPAEPNFKYY